MPTSLHSLLFSTVFLALLPFVLATSAYYDISTLLSGGVFLPDSSAYKASISSYFFLNARESPACIVAPTTAEDVARVVKRLSSCGKQQVAVRSGGHSPNQGFANTDSGVTLDLRGLNKITLHEPAADVVSVGTGALWRHVYAVLDPLNRSVVGARVASVGVGGFLTGGGLSFFSPRYGFGCDSVLNMQVVLANGSIVNANATSNPDLFRALKGGQSNFGIVTRFDLVTYPQPEYWGGAIQYPGSANEAQLSAFESFKTAPYDGFAEIEQTYVYFGALETFSSTNNMFYTKPVVNASALRYFSDIRPQMANTMRISNTSNFAKEIEKFQPTDQFAIYSTLSFPMSTGALRKVHSQWKDATSSIASLVPNITSVLTLQDIPPPPTADAPQNSLPFTPDSTPHKDDVLVLFSLYWSDKANSAFIESVVKDLTVSIQQLVGDEVNFKYLNYAAAWQHPIRSYGKATQEELVRVARRYDPNSFYQKVVSGGFKLRM
ncbi:FAD-dependent monooxygenase CTB5 [Cladobotryum mycophilum]|uniref:FAD-dependent monooxygenase CTB5 n=1 Tax=Cladobotryum mycophilum TaxID=491253 RepID=A0ABR0T0H1_9HYPO